MCNFAVRKQPKNMHQNYIKYNSKIPPKYPRTFAGKERDSETGFSYFGARYYDSDLMTGWLSVDPLADKYPSLSPYAYCAWNPVKLVDPDGRKIRGVRYNHKRGKYVYSIGAILRGTNKYINARIKTESGQVGINNLMNSPEKYTIRVTDKPIFLQNEKEKLNQISRIVLNDTYILISTADKIKDDTYSLLILSDKSIGSIYAKMEDIEQNIESNYSEVANDVGIIEFEKKHPYQTKEERIHGIGAHEEVHAMGNQDEKSAFSNEMKERLEYIEKNYNEE